MNSQTFSLIGYLSVLLWLGVPALWFLCKRFPWACAASLVIVLLALGLAKINSSYHVDRIAPDLSQQQKSAQELADAKRKAAEKARSEDVADVRFAEDGADDFLDKAGLDEADLKYMDKLDSQAEPEWKKAKKTRGSEEPQTGDVDDLVGGENAIAGVKAETLEKQEEKPPILMSEAHMALAHRLDQLNLSAIKVMILLAVIMLLVDYLGRANVYALAILPLPLPSAWLAAVTPVPPVVQRPRQPRRTVSDELAWLVKRGDCFVYLTDDASSAQAIPASLPRLGKTSRPVEVLRVQESRLIDDTFVFEALWYGRACFVVDSADRATALMRHLIDSLNKRKAARAQVRQTVHIVWDLARPLSAQEQQDIERLAKATGFSLFITRPSPSSP